MSSSPKAPKKSFFKRLLRFFLWCGVAVVVLTVLAGIGGYAFYLHVAADLPKLDKIEDYRPPVMAEVYDDAGGKIGEFWTEARILTPIEKIPRKMIEGFVASEDDRFFQHSGVDPYGIARAFVTNLQAGHVVQGASTITQQVTKALLLSPERTYDRKIKEAILATRIEQNLTKDQILYIYLNQTFFGNRAYGVAAAARNYFHKNLEELNLAEIAMIVGLAKAPSLYNPLVNATRSVQRMHYVVDRMVEEGYATKAEGEAAKKFPLKIYEAGVDKDLNGKYAPYFVEHVRRYLQKKYGNELYTGGWKIYTTANLEMNQAAQQAVVDGTDNYAKRFGFRGPMQQLATKDEIIAFGNKEHLNLMKATGEVDSFSDPSYKNAMAAPTPLKPEQRYLGVVTDSTDRGIKILVGRSDGFISKEDLAWAKTPAHGAKPWTPAAGDVIEVKMKTAAAKGAKSALTTSNAFVLDQSSEVQAAVFSFEPFGGAVKAIIGGRDFTKSEFNRATQALRQPGSSIKPLIYAAALDKGYTPSTVVMDSPIVYEESPGKFWKPKNYGGKYYGPTAFRNALVNSRNVVTVRILMDIGTHYATAFMRKVGLDTPIFKYYSMALGANDVLLEELATSYGTFVTGGILPQTYFISKIVDPTGKVIEEHIPSTTPYLISYQPMKAGDSPDKAAKPAAPESNPSGPTASAESLPSETMPMGSGQKSIDEMGFRQDLLAAGEKATKDDALNLTEYEKKVLYGDYIPPGYTITPKTAMAMVSILRDVVRAGTGTRALALKKPAAGKTGTTNGETDAWFIGFTPDMVTGVWVGFDEKIKTLGRGATGGTVAAPIWLSYMTKATEKYVTKDFTIPKWIDLSVYDTPLQVVQGGGDAELGDAGAGTGVAAGPGAGGGDGGGSGGAEFFTKDLD